MSDFDPWTWNYLVPLDELCGSCDGKEAPDPGCDECHGSGREIIGDVAGPGPFDLADAIREAFGIDASEPRDILTGLLRYVASLERQAWGTKATTLDVAGLGETLRRIGISPPCTGDRSCMADEHQRSCIWAALPKEGQQ